MAPTTAHLSVAEYEKLYSNQSGYEYWFGEARQKPMPTYLHGLLQAVLTHLLFLAGYGSSPEVELRSDPYWHPRPDVMGVAGEMEESYPTQPVDVVFEVLSEGEDDIEKKCREYSRIGIPQVFVFDPVQRKIAEWKGTTLLDVTDVLLRNGVTITGKTIWSELDRRLKERRPIGPVI